MSDRRRGRRAGGARAERALGLGLVLVCAAVGCAQKGEPAGAEEAMPAHPFPRWVLELESGVSTLASVRTRFGEPLEIESRPRGGVVIRYAFPEVHWPADDPMRPEISAEGLPVAASPSAWKRFRQALSRFGSWFDATFYYPARQPRPPRQRLLPATVHELEVVFDAQGLLERFDYATHAGSARVPEAG